MPAPRLEALCVDVALVGGSSREFTAYREWLERSYGETIRFFSLDAEPSAKKIDVVLLDLEGCSDPRTIQTALAPETLVIAITNPEAAHRISGALQVSAILEKPLSRIRLKKGFDPILSELRSRDPVNQDEPEWLEFNQVLGQSDQMLAIDAQVRRVSVSDAPVVITGETGTGKTACARAIHSQSARSLGPFLTLDCSSKGTEDLDRMLFGNSQSTVDNRQGTIERADGGTLYLDQIQSLPDGLQARLLRFLQTGMIDDHNGMSMRPVNVRILSGAQVPLRIYAQNGSMRDELVFRLDVLPVSLPALRERPEDILQLVQTMLKRACMDEKRTVPMLSPCAEERLTAYKWPGNLCEIDAVARRIAVLGEGPVVTADMLPDTLGEPCITASTIDAVEDREDAPVSLRDALNFALNLRTLEQSEDGIAPLWIQEQRIIETALAACDGHVGKAAEALQISPSTIYRKMQSWLDRTAA